MKRRIIFIQLIIFIIIIFFISIIGFNYNTFNNNKIEMCYVDNNSEYTLVEKNVINNITSFLYRDDNDHYLSKIYNDNQEVNIYDLIKKDKIESFNKKVEELLYLKYPKFIVESLLQEDVSKSYVLRDNEMVIYYDNYIIEPTIDELLFIKINYNEIKEFIEFSVLLDSKYENESGYNYTNAKKSVAFTFDDSPNKNKTDKIVSYLKDNLFHATFFVVGEKVKYNKDLVINIKSAGNEIGSHTYKHSNMGKMTNEEFINDYNIMNDLYKNIFKENINLIRPPYGVIKDEQLSLIDASFILWSLDTNDWRYRNSDYIINYVIDNIEDGDIILFHDSYDSTVKAIEELLPILYSKGFQVMSVSELFNLKGLELEKNKVYHNTRK